MQAYKLTDANGYTRRGQEGETLWTVGATVRPTGTGSNPCGPGVLHGYITPEVALLGNPIHSRFDPASMRLFRVTADRPWKTNGLNRWTGGACTVMDEIPVPALWSEERVAWAILLTPDASTRAWSIGWLSGRDRSRAAARAAWVRAAEVAAKWAAWAVTSTWAEAEAAARAAEAAAWAESQMMPVLSLARRVLAGDVSADAAWEQVHRAEL